MGSVSPAWVCKSSSFVFLLPTLFSSSHSQLRFKSVTAHSPSPPHRRMGTEASSSPSPLTGGDAINSPAASASSSSSSPSASAAIDFLSLCHRLKSEDDEESGMGEKRREGTGINCGSYVSNGTDGSYCFGYSRCIKMAIVHDIAEAIVGDITPVDGVSKTEKSRREREALDHMCKLLGGGSSAKEIGELWMEYEENSSPEAKVVKDFDKVEMILQALEYESEQGKDLDEFFQSTAGKFQTEIGKAWASEIASRRQKEVEGLGGGTIVLMETSVTTCESFKVYK
ncbi:hypothetical protein TIFTF001_031853 [Ficus carica]|uniref:HD domain-containing protein n=1 Tax=Ficus carica TaxID=3494 RepID=A0AA88DW98_FICCA|nr:hypothetical protein TIFTF001_031853 [Ficus carica]